MTTDPAPDGRRADEFDTDASEELDGLDAEAIEDLDADDDADDVAGGTSLNCRNWN